ncbi:spore gernimation protein GerC [Brevibacillus formosus]|uniref:Ger(x)C family spore germination C-terminal domain-containing protein n=1 Tax=Brevibacillus formosus TaxID=54913 RepID=UPI001CA508EE|nr:Ger(x)C family spore germination C-terminal domain-containing protein [Brevibacillus formosus]MBW5471749.1 spore gernimation protein GerC [Brevibacillus formosus]
MMKKASFAALLLLLLTGCWDQMPLRHTHLVDIIGLDLDEKSNDVVLDYVVTTLKKAGQGEGEPVSETTEFKGPSLIEAVGKSEYNNRGPFIAINTRLYLLSESFATHHPVQKLVFLLNTPNTVINSPVVVVEGSVSKKLKKAGTKRYTEKLNKFIMSLEENQIISNVSMMKLILSYQEALEDLAVPLIKDTHSGVELGGALLFSHGKYTGVKIDNGQVRMMRLLLGSDNVRQRLSMRLSGSGERRPYTGRMKNIEYAFTVKKGASNIMIDPKSSGLPKVSIEVKLQVNAYQLGEGVYTLKRDYVNRMEETLSKHLEEIAVETIKTFQKANCDVLGIGKQIKAYHPIQWGSLDWRKDYPRLSIEPKFNVEILNTDEI